MNNQPYFRVDRTVDPPQAYIICSNCGADVREIRKGEKIRLTRAYFCEKCDDGVIHLSAPRNRRRR